MRNKPKAKTVDSILTVRTRLSKNSELSEMRRLQEVLLRVSESYERERRMSSRKLHDELAQQLVLIQNGILEMDIDKIDSIAIARKAALAHIDQAFNQVRDLESELWPTILDDFGLTAALEWFSSREEMSFNLHIQIAEQRFPWRIEIGIFRLVQQLVANAFTKKHAHSISIDLRLCDDSLCLTFADDRKNMYSIDRASQAWDVVDFGLSVWDRVDLLGRAVKHISHDERGMRLEIIVPLP